MKEKSKKNTFCQLSLVQLIRFKISTLPRTLQSVTKFVYFFNQSDSFLKSDFTSSIVPRNISAIWQKFCTFFPLYYLFFRIFLSEYCSLVVKVSFVLFFWKFCVGFEVKFYVWICYIYRDGWKSFLPSQILCIYICRACTACMSLQKQSWSLPI